MTDTIEIVVYGVPKSQKRHRTYTKGKGGRPLPFARTVDPSATGKMDFLAQVMHRRPDAPWTGPVEMRVKWVMPRPKSHYRSRRYEGGLREDAPFYCTSLRRGDGDNLLKLCQDALNAVFFLDDSQIVLCSTVKVYDDPPERPRTEITLRKLPGNGNQQLRTGN